MSEQNALSPSMQDCLEAILELEERDNSVRITDIANKLKIAKASVNQTIGKFKDMGLVRQQVYGPVELTDDGRDTANKIIQRHRKLKKFLYEVLGVDPETAEKDACLMEHAVSPQTMECLTSFLCRNGYIDEDESTDCSCSDSISCQTFCARKHENDDSIVKKPLSELKTGERGIVLKVASKGEVRRRIMEMGIITGTEIVVKGFAPLGDPMELGIKGYSLSLRKAEAAGIIVELI